MCRVSGFVPKSGRHFGEKTVLTRKQNELLMFINKRLNDDGVSPSFDEMKEALRLKSKSGIHRLITGLEERGFLKRLPHRARALQVLRLPEAVGVAATVTALPVAAHAAGLREPREPFQAQVIRGDFRGALPGATTPQGAVEALSLPLYGRIAAGTPIDALRDNTTTIDVPASLLGPGTHFCLQVQGDSMVEAGILDGDTVVARSTETADSGAIVVALIDDNEATLKRLRRRGAAIALEPANGSYKTQIYPPDRVKIQGRMIGLYRRYN